MITDPAVLLAAEYVAPAALVLTVLHKPAGEPDEAGQPVTRCGLQMDAEGLWLPVERDGEPVCPGCEGKGSTGEEVPLW